MYSNSGGVTLLQNAPKAWLLVSVVLSPSGRVACYPVVWCGVSWRSAPLCCVLWCCAVVWWCAVLLCSPFVSLPVLVVCFMPLRFLLRVSWCASLWSVGLLWRPAPLCRVLWCCAAVWRCAVVFWCLFAVLCVLAVALFLQNHCKTHYLKKNVFSKKIKIIHYPTHPRASRPCTLC